MARKAAGYTAEVAVVGGGPAGLIAAVALAAAGAETVLIAPAPGPDRRTTALLDGSVKALTALGVWEALAAKAAALKVLRLVDATRRLIRAPEVAFDSAELGLEAFGYNIENEVLRDGLFAAVRATKRLRRVDAVVADVTPDDTGVTLRSSAGDERVRLVVAADGRDSFCRKAAGIATSGRKLPRAPSRSRSAIRGRTTISRPSFTPRAGRSRWYRCRGCVQASSGWRAPKKPTRSRRSTTRRLARK